MAVLILSCLRGKTGLVSVCVCDTRFICVPRPCVCVCGRVLNECVAIVLRQWVARERVRR